MSIRIQKEFKLYSQLTNDTIHYLKKESASTYTSTNSDSDGERILLKGIASTTNRDLQNDVVSSDAIMSMAEQAPNLNIHGDHFYGLEDVIGAIKNVSVESDILGIEFLITKRHTPAVQDLLETGVNLGLSIGGYVTDYDETTNTIKAIELREISLTAMPANWDTFGTVTTKNGTVESTCLSGACYNIIKTLNGDTTMTQETKAEESQETPITLEDVKNFLDEYMAEKEATMVEEVTNTVQANVEAIVESKVKELLDEKPEEEEEKPAEEEETKADEPQVDEEEEEETTEEEESSSKSLPNPDIVVTAPQVDISKAIADGILEALGDDFADTVAAKMFSNMDQVRTSKGSKFDAFMKSQTSEEEQEAEPTTTKSTYSTKETAKVLLERQQAANPIMAAAMKNLH